jgi:hypothetical protein
VGGRANTGPANVLSSLGGVDASRKPARTGRRFKMLINNQATTIEADAACFLDALSILSSLLGSGNLWRESQKTSNYLRNTIIRASIAVRSLTQRSGGSGLIYDALDPKNSSRGGTCWNVTLRRVFELFSQTASAP